MFNIKKIIAALAIALMASAGAVVTAEAADAKVSQRSEGWCC